jgi:ABC-2 type transport system ATP-binding protein
MTSPVIALDELTKTYGHIQALCGLSLDVKPGEVFGLVGINGAGKTTTLSVIMGFVRASAGTARVLGLDPWRQANALHRRVAWLPGDVRLPDGLSARHWLEYQFGVAGLPVSALSALARTWEVLLDRPMQTLSKGNRQKVALLRLLASDAEVLILDEPTSGLDPVAQERLLSVLRERAGAGKSVLFSSHSLSEVQTLCDRVAVIDRGRVLRQGTVSALTGSTQTLRVWTRRPLDLDALRAWTVQLITPTHAVLEGQRLLEDALPRLAAFTVERLAFGGLELEQVLERAQAAGAPAQEVRT